MRIGFDFDNTIVNYKNAIQKLVEINYKSIRARDQNKLTIKKHLIDLYGEDEWTRFQGKLYGPGMRFAEPYSNALLVFEKLLSKGHDIYIISQRTKYPFLGERFDLHKEAKLWIKNNLKVNNKFIFKDNNIFFLETREEKIKKIQEVNCEIFIDDLVDVLINKNFPEKCKKILFAPEGLESEPQKIDQKISEWKEFLSCT